MSDGSREWKFGQTKILAVDESSMVSLEVNNRQVRQVRQVRHIRQVRLFKQARQATCRLVRQDSTKILAVDESSMVSLEVNNRQVT